MKKNVFVTGTLIILAVGGFMWWGSANDVPTQSQAEVRRQSALSASERTYDFGLISMKNGNVDHVFKVENPTDKDIMIEKVATSCMCTTAYLVEGAKKIGPFGMEGMGSFKKANKLLKTGETTYVYVAYDPNAHGPAGVGPMERVIQLTEANGGVLELEIKGTVKP